jgi:Lamin Tail Domain
MSKTILLSAIFIVLFSALQAQNLNLRINEIIASNQNGTSDDFFEKDDWIEIYNPAGSPITNLAGYYLTDDATNLVKWQIPNTNAGVTTMLPNSFKALWIDKDPEQGEDHVDFTLSVDGEILILVAPDMTTIIDSITYPEMATDVSYGRTCDGCPDWQYFNNVTFEDNNAEIQASDLLFINEVQTINISTYDDRQHEYDPWIEIYNPNSYQVNLANYYISVDGNPLQWQVPGDVPFRTVIPAGGFKLIWFDNDMADGPTHSPLSLNTSGGTIVITGPDGTTTSDTYTYGSIAANTSYGRQSDGALTSITFTAPTPSVTNSLVFIAPENLYINEVLMANSNDTIDNHGQTEDWVEIYNPNNYAIYLGGYYLSDNSENPSKWLIPNSFPDSVTVQANSWILFWADADLSQGVRHANFRLSNNGEYVGLFSPDGFSIADEIDWGHIGPDTSLGRQTDGSDNWVYFSSTTPEYSNNQGTIDVKESELTPIVFYPNPTENIISTSTLSDFVVMDLAGNLLMQVSRVRSLSLSHLSPGVYLIKDKEGRVSRVTKI